MKRIHRKIIPNQLKKHRKKRGFTQKDVAEILELKSTSMISRWEAGSCLPSTLNTFQLAIIYRTWVDALFLDFLRMMKSELEEREEMIFQNKT